MDHGRKIPFSLINTFFFSLIAVAGGYFLYSSFHQKNSEQALEIGQVVDQSGTVQMRQNRAQGWISADKNSPIYDKTSVFTENASHASIRVRDTIVEIDEKTLVQVLDPRNKTELTMDFGSLKLSSKKDEQIILNVGGERLKISLKSSTVKIQREKKTGSLKVTGGAGLVRIESDHRRSFDIALGQEIHLDPPVAAMAANPSEEMHVETPSLKIHFDSSYVHDETFTHRPSLKLSVLSEIKEARYEVSSDGTTWEDLKGADFVPEREGTYWMRAHGTFAGGGEAVSAPGPWTPKAEHFQFRQPKLSEKHFILDPTKIQKKNLFVFYKVKPELLSVRTVDKTIPLKVGEDFTLADVPAGTKSLRLVSAQGSTFGFEDKEIPLEIDIPAPRAVYAQGVVTLRPIQVSQFRYESFVEETQEVLPVQAGRSIEPDCKKDCTLKIRYRSHLNPDWASAETTVHIKAKVSPPRALAGEDLSPLKQTRVRVKQPWIFELGLGGNYLNMNTTSSLTSASTSGFSGPSLFVSAERQFDENSFKASLLNVHTQMKTSSNGISSEQSLDWRSVWAGASTPGLWIFPRLEYGLSYQDVPLFYQNSNGVGQFETGSILSASLGFNSSFGFGEDDILLWDQRLLIPLSGNAKGAIESFKPKFGIDGALTYYHCLRNQWAIGASWLGQYSQVDFKLPQGNGLLADSPTSTMLNSNFQVRMQYGLCNFEKK